MTRFVDRSRGTYVLIYRVGATESTIADSATMRVGLENTQVIDSFDPRIGWRLAMQSACGLPVLSNISSFVWVMTGAGEILGMCVLILFHLIVQAPIPL